MPACLLPVTVQRPTRRRIDSEGLIVIYGAALRSPGAGYGTVESHVWLPA